MDNTISKEEKIRFAYQLWKSKIKYFEACKILKIDRSTYGRWVHSFKIKGLRKTLKYYGKWSHGEPANKTSKETIKLIKRLREEDKYGRWKMCIILKRDYHIKVSESTISRISPMKGNPGISHYPRKKGDYVKVVPFYPGELVEADPMQVGDLFICNFCDWITRMRFSAIMDAQDMDNAKICIQKAYEYFPFKISRLQWDNGSEAKSETEAFVCELIGSPINHTPPHSPQKNGLVERLNKTLRDEEVGYRQFRPEEKDILQDILDNGIHKYNYYRPHHSLMGRTPMQIWESFVQSNDPILSSLFKN